MKLDTNTVRDIERSGVSSGGTFRIAFTEKMAQMLSDGVYSNKIRAILREISCNALDSHVQAGKPVEPIIVHLPTVFEPFLEIRDVGVGLDHQEVVDIYTVYGESTKVHSNDFIGQMGIGSKSPFNYVDAFDVTAIKHGVKRQYSLFKNEKGVPDWALLGEVATDEPNGVAVRIPVKQKDLANFSSEAVKVFRWFKVKPTVTGVESFECELPKILFKGNGWRIFESTSSYNDTELNQAAALMGQVEYPLSSHNIADLNSLQRALLSMPIKLEFAIGDLTPATSREVLGYDEKTQTNIKKHLDAAVAELRKELEAWIGDAETEWEARARFGKLFGTHGSLRWQLRELASNGLMWKNIVIKDSYVWFQPSVFWTDETKALGFYYRRGGYRRISQVSNRDKISILCSSSTMIIVDDLEKGGLARVNYFLQNHPDSMFYFMTGVDPEEVSKALGNAPYQLTSSLPRKPTAARTKINMLMHRSHHRNVMNAWSAVDVVLEDGGFYVTLDGWKVEDWTGSGTTKDLNRIIEMSRKLGIIDNDAEIYAPRGSFRKKVEASADWIDFLPYVREQVIARLTPDVSAAVDAAEAHRILGNTVLGRDESLWSRNWNLVDEHGAFAQLVDTRNSLAKASAKANTDTMTNLLGLAGIFGKSINASDGPAVKNAQKLYKKVVEQYPMMISVMDSSYGLIGKERLAQFEQYINQCDQLRNLSVKTNASAVVMAA